MEKNENGKKNQWGAPAVIVATCALFVSIYTACLHRHHQRLSVYPVLVTGFHWDEEGSGWSMSNIGIGPGKIRIFEVLVDGKPQPNWHTVSEALGLPDADKTGGTIGVPYQGSIIAAEKIYKIYWFRGPSAETLKKMFGRVETRVCYCSLYDECWLFTDRSEPGEPQKSKCNYTPPVKFGAPPIPTGPLQ